MTSLDDVLRRCPASDEEQRRTIEERFDLFDLHDLSGAVVFGTGILGTTLATTLAREGLAPSAFTDNDRSRWGSTLDGLPVIAPRELDDGRPVIVASKFVKDIAAGLADRPGLHLLPHYLLPVLFPSRFPSGGYHTLCASRIRDASPAIRDVYERLADRESRALYECLFRFRISMDPLDLPAPTPDQYFPSGFWQPDPREVFADVGAFQGDTLSDFLTWSGGIFRSYHAYEPDPANLDGLRRYVDGLSDPRIHVHPCAVGDRRGVITFAAGRGGESRASESGDIEVETVTLDEDLAEAHVTTIKIDVEGAERSTLAGARGLVSLWGPKLAISVYHSVQDLWELPGWVAEQRSDYTYRLRHHTAEVYDTVLYCERRQA